MEEVLLNLRPALFLLVGMVILYFSHLRTKKQWHEKPPKKVTHVPLRIALCFVTFAVFAFVLSSFFTTSLAYTILNAVIMSALMTLHVAKVLYDAKNFHQTTT